MLTRNKAANISGTNMKQDEFTKAFIAALQDGAVIKQIRAVIHEELHQEMAVLRNDLKEKEEKIKGLQKQVEELKVTADKQEQYSRRNSLRIFGLPETEHEGASEVALQLTNNDLGLDITTIDRAYRVGRQNTERTSPRPILVKFATYKDREAVYKRKKNIQRAGMST